MQEAYQVSARKHRIFPADTAIAQHQRHDNPPANPIRLQPQDLRDSQAQTANKSKLSLLAKRVQGTDPKPSIGRSQAVGMTLKAQPKQLLQTSFQQVPRPHQRAQQLEHAFGQTIDES
jgi:hypothetical protein